MFDIVIRLLLSAAALAGIYFCLRWGLPQFRLIRPDACEPIARSPFSNFFGLQFWQMGLVAYFLILLAGITSESWLVLAGFLVSILALLASFYLLIIMIGKLRASCSLCWASHAINVAILAIWMVIALHG